MSKELYGQALSDVLDLKQVAESNARKAVIEAVTPRIRMLIEKQLLSEDAEVDDLEAPDSAASAASAISPPDAEGKVTLDIDAISDGPSPPVEEPLFGEPKEYELGLEGLKSFDDVITASRSGTAKQLEADLVKLGEDVERFSAASPIVRRTPTYQSQICEMISRAENMYVHVQESVSDPASKSSHEDRLESYYKKLTKLQESAKMSKPSTLNGRINEADDEGSDLEASDSGEELTLKLTGLPDDIDLDSVGVDLIGGGGDDGEMDAGDDMGDQSGGDEEIDLGDLDLDDQGGGPSDQMEVSKLSDDTIVEIDEKMLAREIKKMRQLRELQARDMNEPVPSSEGSGGEDPEALDDFGGGSSEGDPVVDATVRTEGDDADAPSLSETRRKLRVAESALKASTERLSRLQRLARTAAPSKRARIKEECGRLSGKIREARLQKLKLSQALRKESASTTERSNSVRRAQPVSRRETELRKKLAESNLYNVKLSYANKVLQSSMSRAQKATVIERLDEAKTPREAKMAYDSVVDAFKADREVVNESATRKLPLGSGSRVTRPASTEINEGFETQRWAKLAGITE